MILYLHLETPQERPGHTIMIIDQQRLILMIKTHSSGKGLTCDRKREKT